MYDPKTDIYVSEEIIRAGYFEKNTMLLIKKLLTTRMKNDSVFLDAGANLGIHSLFAAKLGYRVWSIEPQEQNLRKVITLTNYR